MITLQHIIDGDNVTGTSETLFDIYDPSTGKITKQIKGEQFHFKSGKDS